MKIWLVKNQENSEGIADIKDSRYKETEHPEKRPPWGWDPDLIKRTQSWLIGWQVSHCAAEQTALAEYLSCRTHQNMPPGVPGKAMCEICHWRQSTVKVPQKAAGRCWLPRTRTGQWRSCTCCSSLTRVAHQNWEGKPLSPAKSLHGSLVTKLNIMPSGKGEILKGLRSILAKQAMRGKSESRGQNWQLVFL